MQDRMPTPFNYLWSPSSDWDIHWVLPRHAFYLCQASEVRLLIFILIPSQKRYLLLRNTGPSLKFIGHAASAQRFQSPYIGSFASELLGGGQRGLITTSTSSAACCGYR